MNFSLYNVSSYAQCFAMINFVFCASPLSQLSNSDLQTNSKSLKMWVIAVLMFIVNIGKYRGDEREKYAFWEKVRELCCLLLQTFHFTT